VGNGSAAVLASHTGGTYRTAITTTGVANKVEIGHTLPRGTRPAAVMLDGLPVHNYELRATNRGIEVTLPTGPATTRSC
jgi:hypothetical protein